MWTFKNDLSGFRLVLWHWDAWNVRILVVIDFVSKNKKSIISAAPSSRAFLFISIPTGKLITKLSASVNTSLQKPLYCLVIFPTSSPCMVKILYSMSSPQLHWQKSLTMVKTWLPPPSFTLMVGTKKVLSRLSVPSSAPKLLMVMACSAQSKQHRQQKTFGHPHGEQTHSRCKWRTSSPRESVRKKSKGLCGPQQFLVQQDVSSLKKYTSCPWLSHIWYLFFCSNPVTASQNSTFCLTNNWSKLFKRARPDTPFPGCEKEDGLVPGWSVTTDMFIVFPVSWLLTNKHLSPYQQCPPCVVLCPQVAGMSTLYGYNQHPVNSV